MKKITKLLTVASAMLVMMLAMTFTTMAATTVTPTRSMTGSEKAVTQSYTFTQNTVLDTEFTLYKTAGVVIPVKVSESGALEINVKANKVEKIFYMTLYTDAACTNKVSGLYDSFNVGDSNITKYVALGSKNTYYLRLETNSFYTPNNEQFTDSITVSYRFFPRAERTIKSGQTIKYYRNQGSDIYTFKYKAEATGKVTVSLPYKWGSYLTFKNQKKSDILTEQWVSSIYSYKYNVYVKKGAVYYFVTKSNGINANTLQSISIKNTAVKVKMATNRKKAITIKHKKSAKCLITPGDKSAKWYQISLKKNRHPYFDLRGDVTGVWKLQICNKKGKAIKNMTFRWYGSKSKITTWGGWKKGTYYFKVTPADSKSYGLATFKYKQAK